MEDVPVGISLIYIISNNLINRRRGFNRALKRERKRERDLLEIGGPDGTCPGHGIQGTVMHSCVHFGSSGA